jgi:hypothetical protein
MMDRTRGSLVVDRWGVEGHSRREWKLDAIAAAQVIEKSDDEGGRVYQLHLVLRGDRPVPVSMLWTHDRAAVDHAAKRIAQFADVQEVNAVSDPSPEA